MTVDKHCTCAQNCRILTNVQRGGSGRASMVGENPDTLEPSRTAGVFIHRKVYQPRRAECRPLIDT